MKRRFVPIAVLLLAGCGSVIRQGSTSFDFMNPGCGSQVVAVPRDAVEVRYLGSGGVYIRWRDDALLVGPYFSHPGNVVRPVTGRVRFDRERIAQGMKGVDRDAVRAILVGHSHFDHIGDVPVVAREYVPNARVYVNDAGINELAAYRDIDAVSYEQDHDRWITIGGAIRFMPVPSDHAPQLCKWRRWPCTYADGPVPAAFTKEWGQQKLRALRSGNTHAFVIELLDNGKTRYRIYYNDAASSRDRGIPPMQGFDLAILCMASFHFVKDYPEALLAALQPRHVLVSHYDDFFAKQGAGHTRFAPLLTNGRAATFLRKLDGGLKEVAAQRPINDACGPQTAHWSMPEPQSTLYFMPPEGSQ